jgi:uncharacterized protein YndB with AHSA1/START domain
VSDARPNILDNHRIMALFHDRSDKNVALSSRICADRSRIFHAVSIPEYIEAWLRFPLEEGLRFVFDPIAEQAFRITLYRAEAPIRSIHANCYIRNSSQIRYTWKTRFATGITNNVVDIKLLPVSGGCTLALSHSGFQDAADSAWHSKVWQLSLENLCRLMEK